MLSKLFICILDINCRCRIDLWNNAAFIRRVLSFWGECPFQFMYISGNVY